MISKIIRGELHFELIGKDTVQCYLGDPEHSDSEFIFEVHESYVNDIVAGLIALKFVKAKN